MQTPLARYAALLLSLPAAISWAESAAPERQALSLTVYQQDYALVRDQRRVELPAGRSKLHLHGLSEALRPGSLRVEDGTGLLVLARRHESGDLSRQRLLERHVGQRVLLLGSHPQTGETLQREARLLSVEGEDAVVRVDDQIEIVGPDTPWRVAYPRLPAELSGEPRLTLELQSDGGEETLTLTYLTGGVSWQADYIATLAADGAQMELSGWATLHNRTSTPFSAATVQLMAGDVQQQAEQGHARMELQAAPAAAAPAREAVGGYHLYSLEQPVDLQPRQTVQVPLLSTRKVAVTRTLRTEGHALQQIREPAEQPVTLLLRYDNRPPLGQPLPAGQLRVYGEDAHGRSQFLGTDQISHTAVGETAEATLGHSFDVTAEREQIVFRRLNPELLEVAWRIRVQNARDHAVTVQVRENLPGDWEIQETSHSDYERSAHQARWQLTVPAGDQEILSYRARIRR